MYRFKMLSTGITNFIDADTIQEAHEQVSKTLVGDISYLQEEDGSIWYYNDAKGNIARLVEVKPGVIQKFLDEKAPTKHLQTKYITKFGGAVLRWRYVNVCVEVELDRNIAVTVSWNGTSASPYAMIVINDMLREAGDFACALESFVLRLYGEQP